MIRQWTVWLFSFLALPGSLRYPGAHATKNAISGTRKRVPFRSCQSLKCVNLCPCGSLQLEAHEERVVVGVAVVARAAGGEGEPEAGVEGDCGGAGSADLEDNFGGALRTGPVEDGAAEGAADAGVTIAGGDDDALQFGYAFRCGGMQQADGEACELFVPLRDDKTALDCSGVWR